MSYELRWGVADIMFQFDLSNSFIDSSKLLSIIEFKKFNHYFKKINLFQVLFYLLLLSLLVHLEPLLPSKSLAIHLCFKSAQRLHSGISLSSLWLLHQSTVFLIFIGAMFCSFFQQVLFLLIVNLLSNYVQTTLIVYS